MSDTFSDPNFRNVIQMGDKEYTCPPDKQPLLVSYGESLCRYIQQLHGIKPFDRKQWTVRNFSGRGFLSINDIVMASVQAGAKKLKEKRRTIVNPDKPSVALLMDVSMSMTHGQNSRAAQIMGIMFCEFFKNFAKRFFYSTIGESVAHTQQNAKLEDIKRQISRTNLGESSTMFTPAFNDMEKYNFFQDRTTKYVFIITDGLPEINKVASINVSGVPTSLTNDVNASHDQIGRIIAYIKNRWQADDRIEYFWIQIGNENDMLDFVARTGYLPEEQVALKKFSQAQYDSAKARYKAGRIWAKWSEFLWNQWMRGNIYFMNKQRFIEGKEMHPMINYFMTKFRRRVKS